MTTFLVDDVPIETKLYQSAKNSAEIFAARSGNRHVLPEAFSKLPSDGVLLHGGNINAFVQTVHIAYERHYPLVISPDDIWMCIAQGFGAHVNANAEKLRHLFVKHEGKEVIKVQRDTFVKGSPDNPWSEVFSEFSAQIRSYIGEKTHDLLIPSFTTTGPIEKAASEIVLMNAFKEYFDYRVCTLCGIPKITLKGTVDDWKQLRERALGLAQFELEWWIDALKVILDRFVEAAEGNVNKQFWSTIYKRVGGSGGPYVTGWIVTLFPYLNDRRNRFLENWDFKEKEKRDGFLFGGATTSSLPPGVASTPFIWEYLGKDIPMTFNAGFMGTVQNPMTFAVSTVIGWTVVDGKKVQEFERKREEEIKKRQAHFKIRF